MAAIKTPKARTDIGNDREPIIIQYTVAVINPGDGPESMVATAFLEAGRFIETRAVDGENAELEFRYGNMRFFLGCTPSDPSALLDHDEDYR